MENDYIRVVRHEVNLETGEHSEHELVGDELKAWLANKKYNPNDNTEKQ